MLSVCQFLCFCAAEVESRACVRFSAINRPGSHAFECANLAPGEATGQSGGKLFPPIELECVIIFQMKREWFSKASFSSF